MASRFSKLSQTLLVTASSLVLVACGGSTTASRAPTANGLTATANTYGVGGSVVSREEEKASTTSGSNYALESSSTGTPASNQNTPTVPTSDSAGIQTKATNQPEAQATNESENSDKPSKASEPTNNGSHDGYDECGCADDSVGIFNGQPISCPLQGSTTPGCQRPTGPTGNQGNPADHQTTPTQSTQNPSTATGSSKVGENSGADSSNGSRNSLAGGFGELPAIPVPVIGKNPQSSTTTPTSPSSPSRSEEPKYEKLDRNLNPQAQLLVAGKPLANYAIVAGQRLTNQGHRAVRQPVGAFSNLNSSLGFVDRKFSGTSLGTDVHDTTPYRLFRDNSLDTSSTRVINNPAYYVNPHTVDANGSSALDLHTQRIFPSESRTTGGDPVPNLGQDINSFYSWLIESSNYDNLGANHRFYSLKGIQKTLGNAYAAANNQRFVDYYYNGPTPSPRYGSNTAYLGLAQPFTVSLDTWGTQSAFDVIEGTATQRDHRENSRLALNGQDVTVAIIDTAVDYHPLLAGRVKSVLPYGVYNPAVNHGKALQNWEKYNPGVRYPENHGKSTALLIAAAGHPTLAGTQGIAPNAHILAGTYHYRVTKIAQLLRALDADRGRNAQKSSIYNFSLVFSPQADETNEGLLAQLKLMAKRRDAPLFVYAAGNLRQTGLNNGQLHSDMLRTIVQDQQLAPVSLVVSAVSPTPETQGYKNLNLNPRAIPCGDLAANCLVGLWSDVVAEPNANTLKQVDAIWQVGGTSVAAAQVSGVAALVKQMFPFFNGNNLRQTLLTTATDLGEPGVDQTYGWGLVNAERAIKGPAAFTSGDFIVNLNGDAIYENNRVQQDGIYNYYFRNNIVGTGGLVYYSDQANRRLVLTGNNRYLQPTRVLRGKLNFDGGSSASELEISARGEVQINQHRLYEQAQNYGFLAINRSQLAGQVRNFGTIFLQDSQIFNNVQNHQFSILYAHGQNLIKGNLALDKDSVFITTAPSTLRVRGTAHLDGAFAVISATYQPNHLYLILDADNFSPTGKRFTKIYRMGGSLDLRSYDLVYDDKLANVYVLPRTDKHDEATKVSASKSELKVPSQVYRTIDTGLENIDAVLAQAQQDYDALHEQVSKYGLNLGPGQYGIVNHQVDNPAMPGESRSRHPRRQAYYSPLPSVSTSSTTDTGVIAGSIGSLADSVDDQTTAQSQLASTQAHHLLPVAVVSNASQLSSVASASLASDPLAATLASSTNLPQEASSQLVPSADANATALPEDQTRALTSMRVVTPEEHASILARATPALEASLALGNLSAQERTVANLAQSGAVYQHSQMAALLEHKLALSDFSQHTRGLYLSSHYSATNFSNQLDSSQSVLGSNKAFSLGVGYGIAGKFGFNQPSDHALSDRAFSKDVEVSAGAAYHFSNNDWAESFKALKLDNYATAARRVHTLTLQAKASAVVDLGISGSYSFNQVKTQRQVASLDLTGQQTGHWFNTAVSLGKGIKFANLEVQAQVSLGAEHLRLGKVSEAGNQALALATPASTSTHLYTSLVSRAAYHVGATSLQAKMQVWHYFAPVASGLYGYQTVGNFNLGLEHQVEKFKLGLQAGMLLTDGSHSKNRAYKLEANLSYSF